MKNKLMMASVAIAAALLPPAALAADGVPLLTGKVVSTTGEALAGIPIKARRDNSPMTVAVYTDAKGEYSFPAWSELKAGGYSVAVDLPDLLQRGAAGFGEHLGSAAPVVSADREGQKIEPGVDAPDSGLFLVQGKSPFLKPGAQSGGDRLGLLAGVAQCHEIVRVGDHGRASGFHATTTTVVVFDTRGGFHSLQRNVHQQR